ncbi:MAG: hypothetical protein KatS3mg110_2051 [Pirellulaceae bacterium]|nr:MAG: hypothetical protein KatS3mg110_2051 [Pirellulaceae bacterium]
MRGKPIQLHQISHAVISPGETPLTQPHQCPAWTWYAKPALSDGSRHSGIRLARAASARILLQPQIQTPAGDRFEKNASCGGFSQVRLVHLWLLNLRLTSIM